MIRIASIPLVTILLISIAAAETLDLKGAIRPVDPEHPAPFGVETREIVLTTERPEGSVAAPEGVVDVWSVVHEVAGRSVTVLVGRGSEESKHFDVLFLDADGDGTFGDGERHGLKAWTRNVRGLKIIGGTATGISVRIGDRELPFDLKIARVEALPPTIRLTGRWCLETRFSLGEESYRLAVQDGDVDGRFDGTDDRWIVASDSPVIRPLRWFDLRAAGEGLFLAGRRFEVTRVEKLAIALTIDSAEGPSPADQDLVRRRIAKTWTTRFEGSRERFVKDTRLDTSRPEATRSLPWLHLSFEEALAKAREQKKPLFVDLRAFWSGNCYLLDLFTYTDAEVVRLLGNRFILAMIIQEQDPGGDYRRLAKQLGGGANPAQGVWSPDGELLHGIRGWRRPRDMVKELNTAFEKLRPDDSPPGEGDGK